MLRKDGSDYGVNFWHSVECGIVCGTDSITYVCSLFNFMEFCVFVRDFVSFSQRGLKWTKKTDVFNFQDLFNLDAFTSL